MESPDQKYPKPLSIDSSPSSTGKNSILNPFLSKNIITILIVVIVISVAGILLFVSLRFKSLGINPITYAQCSQLAQEIDTLVKQANYCEVDEDCMVGPEMPGRCLDLLNKNADVASIQEKSLQRQKLDCDKGVVYEQCLRAPQAVKCQQNQCVGVWDQGSPAINTSNWQTYRNDEFGFEVKYPPLWSDNSSGDGATLGENRIDIGIIAWNDGSTEYVETQWKQIDCAPGNDPNGGCSPLYNKEEKKLSLNSYTVYFKIDGRGQIHAYIPNRAKNKTVEIYTVYLTDRKIFDQILSTFRFVE